MNKPKDAPGAGGMLRKVAKFVANPTTDWAKLTSPSEDNPQIEADKAELRAMLERKRRNDFVRKREFDMLRRVRREGLSPEQAAAIDRSSRLDESEGQRGEAPSGNRSGMKDKIDAIEQQMVGASHMPAARVAPRPPAPRPPGDDLATVPMALMDTPNAPTPAPAPLHTTAPAPAPTHEPDPLDFRVSEPAPPPALPRADLLQPDPELDEAVIAFANADFAAAEAALLALTSGSAPRRMHPDTWLARFDLYRATGQQIKFEALAMDFAVLFARSAPQWISLPQRVADASQDVPSRPAGQGEVGWVCAEHLDADAVARLHSQTLQMPEPWVLDWGSVERVDVEAASALCALLRTWSTEPLKMRWLGGDKLLTVLQDQAPAGVRDADPAFWMLRLELLRAADRPDQFDEAAIDYCVTFEVSPPSWERARCTVRMAGPGSNTRLTSLSVVGDVVTSFLESTQGEDSVPAPVEVATLELSGQLVGDIQPTLAALDAQIGEVPVIRITCSRLIRVDFSAASDLLNWVIAKRGQNRTITFHEVHRMVGLFFGAMGVVEHAQVRAMSG